MDRIASVTPILRDIPDRLETTRLTLRVPEPLDGPAVFEAIIESLPELQPWMPWLHDRLSLDDEEQFVRQSQARFLLREELTFLIFLRGAHRLVGSISLHHIDWDVPRFEIGYWLRTADTHRGLATEAVMGLTDFAHAQLSARRIEIRCDEANQRSASVARRAGYVLDGILRHNERHPDSRKLVNTLIFARWWPDNAG